MLSNIFRQRKPLRKPLRYFAESEQIKHIHFLSFFIENGINLIKIFL